MLCYRSMAADRALVDAMQIPFVGNDANVMASYTNDAQLCTVVAAACVP